MKIVWKILSYLLAAFFIYAGVQHFIKPVFYEPFVPYFLPYKSLFVYASGVLEVLFGVLVFVPRFARVGATGILLLLIAFLPVHIMDVFAETPAIGTKTAAYIRLAVQFLFIAWALGVRKSITTK
ncbi:DoxX family membrane protein [Aggregatimonas sangjinii]|uniref:DoxX family membrane protein n=1 Tax=Aggregatimonas sangjinii TaxID=2583587 RepID=A0A5B7ST60_9FLAO|nr:MauE/DoxX family redox-associated membrane protein [Aggregatimonas sangjinii]QCX00040.1 DoxX family membrane protein [Aggregatimonas sangjinii]